MKHQCPECGATLIGISNCRDYFNQMLTWDFEDFKDAGSVHHLTVLCYYLQHPSLYSLEALEHAKQLLKDVIENDTSAEKILQNNRKLLKINDKDWSIRGTSQNHGAYLNLIKWSTTADDIVSLGVIAYTQYVKKWAHAIYSDLKDTGNLE